MTEMESAQALSVKRELTLKTLETTALEKCFPTFSSMKALCLCPKYLCGFPFSDSNYFYGTHHLRKCVIKCPLKSLSVSLWNEFAFFNWKILPFCKKKKRKKENSAHVHIYEIFYWVFLWRMSQVHHQTTLISMYSTPVVAQSFSFLCLSTPGASPPLLPCT